MKWYVVTGRWRHLNNEKAGKDIWELTGSILRKGDGIVTGGSPGIESFAIDEALRQDKSASRLKVVLPTSLKVYLDYIQFCVDEKRVPMEFGFSVVKQLTYLNAVNPGAIIEGKDIPGQIDITTTQLSERNRCMIALGDELIVVQAGNGSNVTTDAIEKAKKKGITIREIDYTVH